MAWQWRIEVQGMGDRWLPVPGLIDTGRGSYLQGYLAASGERPGPRAGVRLVRTRTGSWTDAEVYAEAPARADVSLGAHPGSPPPEAYEAAAVRALETARMLREMQSRSDARTEARRKAREGLE